MLAGVGGAVCGGGVGVDVVVAVVDTAFCGVAERVVRAGDLGEAVGCRGVAAVAVGVVF